VGDFEIDKRDLRPQDGSSCLRVPTIAAMVGRMSRGISSRNTVVGIYMYQG
jgi:hypothetical protein